MEGGAYMPLAMAQRGKVETIKKINDKDEVKRFLESLGFVVGSEVMVVSELSGNMIVNIKDSRVAISKAMATRIFV